MIEQDLAVGLQVGLTVHHDLRASFSFLRQPQSLSLNIILETLINQMSCHNTYSNQVVNTNQKKRRQKSGSDPELEPLTFSNLC